jgi:hypothetical protein
MLSWHRQMPGASIASKQQQHNRCTVAKHWRRRVQLTQPHSMTQQQC